MMPYDVWKMATKGEPIGKTGEPIGLGRWVAIDIPDRDMAVLAAAAFGPGDYEIAGYNKSTWITVPLTSIDPLNRTDPVALSIFRAKARRSLDRLDQHATLGSPDCLIRSEIVCLLAKIADWMKTDAMGISSGGIPGRHESPDQN
jgi:hypothetical protein